MVEFKLESKAFLRNMVFHDDEEKDKEGAVTDEAIGEVLEETETEDEDEIDPLMAEEKEDTWE
jgi:hypothetical protein